MLLFHDTCIFVHSANRFDIESSEFASQLIDNEEWITSDIVHTELKHITSRRDEIYEKVINYDIGKKIGSTFSTLYTECFHSTLHHDYENDERHLKELFAYCIKKIGAGDSTKITNELLKQFNRLIHAEMATIRNRLKALLDGFEKASFIEEHVVDYRDEPISKKIRYVLYDIPNLRKNRPDLDILVDAIVHSNEESVLVTLVTTDSHFLSARSSILTDIRKLHLPIQIEIGHLKEVFGRTAS